MWTKKGKYGLKALLHLAALPPGRIALSAEIAAAHALPQKFLEAILLELRNAGFVHSRKGKGGGYALALPASEIRIGEVVRALEGPLAPIACASQRFYRRCDDCPDEVKCAVHFLTLDVRNAIAGVLDTTTVEDMLIRLGTTPALAEAGKGGTDRKLQTTV
jgi:Rrf2 family protein